MSPLTFAALVRGQVALGVSRTEAKKFARFVVGTLSAARQGPGNEKATVPAVASSVLSKHVSSYADLSTKELRTQDLRLTNPQNSPLSAPIKAPRKFKEFPTQRHETRRVSEVVGQ